MSKKDEYTLLKDYFGNTNDTDYTTEQRLDKLHDDTESPDRI